MQNIFCSCFFYYLSYSCNVENGL